jgi:hypothetical protein
MRGAGTRTSRPHQRRCVDLAAEAGEMVIIGGLPPLESVG